MQLTTTFALLRKASACKPRYEFLRNALSRDEYTDDTPINLLTILETNGLVDAVWALSATAEDCDKVARLMAADIAELALPIWQKYSEDNRPELAIKAARDFARGAISSQELAAARDAAWAAARDAAWAAARDAGGDARAAEAAARDAGWAARAAWDAARDAGWAAVRYAAWAAARDAAWAAARDAGGDARAAAQEKQREIFISYLEGDE